MTRSTTLLFLLLTLVLTVRATAVRSAEPADLGPHLKNLRAVGVEGQGHRDAMHAWKQLSQADASQLTAILAGMKGAGKLADNWFRAVVETVAQRQLDSGEELPVPALEEFLADTTQSPRARRLAYELVAQVDKTAEQRLIAPLIDDPSLELRRDAIVLAIVAADARLEAGEKEEGTKAYQRVFQSTRDLDQIKLAAAKLRELDRSVDLPRHMGFVLRWNLTGPFDNAGGIGFDKVYPPEDGVDLAANYLGKLGPTRWQAYLSEDDFGIVDLNGGFKRPEAKQGSGLEFTKEHTGVVAYAYAEFNSAESRLADFRIGCINANKLWLNGVLLTANHVYHSGMEVDQYVAQAKLKRGRNTLLVKVVQNEQKEDWAQRWQFQLRVCDELGTALLSRDRDLEPPAATQPQR